MSRSAFATDARGLRVLQDPSDNLDYTIDWTDWLGGDTIVTSSWVVTAGLTEGANANTTTSATVWLTGGTAGTSYVATNTIITAAARTANRSFNIDVVDR